jgi:hypothetical protein
MNLEFLRSVAERHGKDDFFLVDKALSYAQSLEAAELTELASVYREILNRRMERTLVDYVDDHWRSDRLVQHVRMLLRLFSYLCQLEIQPFAMDTVKCFVGPEIDGWEEVPASLQFLVPYARKYGELYGELDIYEFLDDCTPQMKQEIVDVMNVCSARYRSESTFQSTFDAFIAQSNLRRLRAAHKFFWMTRKVDG